MKHFIKEGVSLSSFQYVGNDELHYSVKNAEGQEYEIDEGLFRYLLENDWDEPLELPIELKPEIPRLIEEKIIQTSRLFHVNWAINRLLVSCVRCESEKTKSAMKWANQFLPVGSVAFFLLGLLSALFHGRQFNDYIYLWLFYLLFALSVALHEVGHMIASLASGAEHGQLGILLFLFFPFGAYYGHRDDIEMSQKEAFQFSLAGVEMNLLIAGFCLFFDSGDF